MSQVSCRQSHVHRIKGIGSLIAIGILSCSNLFAETPWPPLGSPPSVDNNSFGIGSMLNGGVDFGGQIQNYTPFCNIVLDLQVPATNTCAIRVQPDLPGLLMYDLDAIRFCNPVNPLELPGPPLWFDPNDQCGLQADLVAGLRIYDPRAVRLCLRNPLPNGPLAPPFWLGPNDECGFSADPQFGLRIYDRLAVRLCNILDPLRPPPLWFGGNNECGFEVRPDLPDPTLRGLRIYDPSSIRICPPIPGNPIPPFWFGPQNFCGFQAFPNEQPGLRGLRIYDVDAVRLCPPTPNFPIPPFWFGEGNNCGFQAVPGGGLRIYDPATIRFCNPQFPQLPPFLRFGDTDNCGIGIIPDLPGLTEQDPGGFRLLGQLDPETGLPIAGCQLLFGPTQECSVEVDPRTPDKGGQGAGLLLRDPRGVRVLNPNPTGTPQLIFGGPDDLCRIRIGPPGERFGMIFEDPRDFQFASPVHAPAFITDQATSRTFRSRSSKRWKENIQTITGALDRINALRGVTFDWKKEEGGTASIGFIAEEVAEVLPQLVSFEEDGKTAEGVQYSNITALLVEGVKEQQQQIDANHKAFELLKAENAELKSKLAESKKQSERTSRLENEVQQLRDQLDSIVETLTAN